MIVHYCPEGWQIITQRAHGLLAFQLGLYWKDPPIPDRWAETLLAIAEHDDAEMELGGEQLLTAAGGPLDYKMKHFDLGHCKKLHELAVTKSRYMSILISCHLSFIFHDAGKENMAARRFLMNQVALQRKWSKELGVPLRDIKKAYLLLQWCDALSLLICQRAMPPESRTIEISKGPGSVIYHLCQLDDKTLTVSPWPFTLDKFTVRYEYRMLTQMAFRDNAAFRKCFTKASVREITWQLKKIPVD